jgi:hormone-sensitive lipase
MYTRRWAKGIQVPFFSVDYRKSPEYPYPAALDDCFQVYMWLVTFFDQVYGNYE